MLAAARHAARAETLRIVPITSNDTVVVSFELSDAYTDEVKQAIASGLRTTFTYDIELRMVVPTWVDRTIATARVISDQYDNLTRRHTLSRVGRWPRAGRDRHRRRRDRAAVADDAVAPAAGRNREARSEPRLLRPHQRARPAPRRLAHRLGQRVIGQAKFTFIP